MIELLTERLSVWHRLKIFLSEMDRLWDYWLGLPVPPRSWEIRLPRREEL